MIFLGKIVKIIVSIILIFFAVPYIAYGTFKYLNEEQSERVDDIKNAMEDVYGSFPKMDEEIGVSEFIELYNYTLFYGWAIAIVSFILGMFANTGGSKKTK